MPRRSRRPVVETLERRITLTASVGPAMHESLWEQVIVAFHDDVQDPRAAAESVVNPIGGRLGHVYEHSIGGFSAQLPAVAARGLAHHPLIRSVETDIVMAAHGQVIPTGVSRINADVSTVGGTIGEGKEIDVDIAIIDSGIAPHPDLNVVDGQRFYTVTSGRRHDRGSFQDGNYADDNGHGTHVAGTVAARDNGSGVVGVAPGARLWAVKVLDAAGNGYMSDVIAGIDWVTERAETISVANMSLGGTGKSDALHAAIQRSVDAGIVYTVSAGNGWEDIHGLSKTFNTTDDVIPAAYPEVATIAAFADSDGAPGGDGPATSWGEHGEDDAWWGPSNFSNSDGEINEHFLDANPVDSPGLGIDLILPGVDILSTYLNDGFATMSGTSMAAPHAAGLAALHIAANDRAAIAPEVYAIRQALIDSGPAWNAPEGLAVHWGPAAYMANIGWAGEITPSEDPTVAIQSPADGDIVWGDVVVTASATVIEGAEIDSINVLRDDELLGAMQLDGDLWSFTWATLDADGDPLYPDGTYQLTIELTDSESRSANDSVAVTLANVDEKPTVHFVSPNAGATLSGTVEIIIEAHDDRGVDSVDVFLDDESAEEPTLVGQATYSGDDRWTLDVDSTAITDGGYTLRAVATDTGSQTTETTVAVSIDNSVAAANVELSGTAFQLNRNFWRARVTATVTDNNGAPLAGAEVIGRWGDSSDLVSLSTDSQGRVLFESQNLRNTNSIEFTVIDVTDYEYGGSDRIRVFQDGSTEALSIASEDKDQDAGTPSPIDWALAAPVPATGKPAGPAFPVSQAALDEFFLSGDF